MVDPDYPTLTVANFIPSFMPQKLLAFLGNTNPHTKGVKTRRFGEVANVERNFLLLKHPTTVLNAVIEPLVMASRVGIDPHVQVILKGLHFCHHVQIATLKEGVEFKLTVKIDFRVHPYKLS